MIRSIVFILFFLTFTFGSLNAQNLLLEIVGKNDMETRILDSLNYVKSFKDYNSLIREIDTTLSKIQRLGFIESEISSIQKIDDSTYHSKFNLKRRFHTIYIYYSKNDLRKEVLNNRLDTVTDTYFVINISEIEDVLNYLNAKLAEDGQPFTQLKLVDIKKKDDVNLQARLMIHQNEKRNIDEIVIKGYEKFPRTFLKRYLQIKPKAPFNLKKIKEKTASLSTLPFTNQVRSPEVLFTQDETHLYFYIEKVKANRFDGFLGFGTNENTNKIEFDGYLDLKLINNLNYGESFELRYKSDENKQKTFDAALNMPYLFGSPLGTEFNLNIFKKDSTFTTVNQSADLFYQLNERQRLFLGVTGTQSNNLLNNNPIENLQDFTSIQYTLKYDYGRPQLNSILFPIKLSVKLRTGFGNRKSRNESIRQQTYFIDLFKIFNLNDRNSFYLGLNSAGIFSDNFLTNELLRFGGIRSIRGFEENSLAATLYSVLNTEYRYQLSPSVYVHSIFDAAYLDDDLSQLKKKLFGFGFGFGIMTRSGLLKMNYANGKFEDQKFKISNSKIHLSLNTRF